MLSNRWQPFLQMYSDMNRLRDEIDRAMGRTASHADAAPPVGQQTAAALAITEVFADFDADTMSILGVNFNLGQSLAVTLGDTEIVLCLLDEAVYALDNICTHEYAQLADGFIEGDCIECPLHQAQFHIPSGRAMSPPADEDLATYPVRVQDGEVYVRLAAAPGAQP